VLRASPAFICHRPKRLEILTELARTETVAVLLNSNDPSALDELKDVQDAANALTKSCLCLRANSEAEINTALQS